MIIVFFFLTKVRDEIILGQLLCGTFSVPGQCKVKSAGGSCPPPQGPWSPLCPGLFCRGSGKKKERTLDGRNRARVIAESLARVIAAIQITSVRWRSYLPLKTQNLVLVDPAFMVLRFGSSDWRSLV